MYLVEKSYTVRGITRVPALARTVVHEVARGYPCTLAMSQNAVVYRAAITRLILR